MINYYSELKKCFKYIKPYRIKIICIFLFTFLGVLIGLLQPKLLGTIIDTITAGQYRDVIYIAILMLGINILSGLFSSASGHLLSKVGMNVVYDMKTRFYGNMIRLSMRKYDSITTGELISRYENDIFRIADILTSTVIDFVMGILTVMITIFFMFQINIVLGIVVVLFFPIGFFMEKRFTTLYRKETIKIRNNNDTYMSLFTDTIAGIREVKHMVIENLFEQKMNRMQQDFIKLFIKRNILRIFNNYSKLIVSVVLDVILLIISVKYIEIGLLTIGSYIALTDYSSKFYKSVNDVIKLYSSFSEVSVSIDRITEIEHNFLASPVKGETKNNKNIEFHGDIVFKDVNFSYHEEIKVLSNFNAVFKNNSCNLVIGQSGLGKTTILKLLLKFYPVDSGTIAINGTDIATIDEETIRKRIAYVPQNPYFFNGTIRDNILYANNDISDEEIYDIFEQVGLKELILSLPDKIESAMQEAGNNFSEGQKQRINFARAIAKGSDIYLLDEPTSSLDYKNKMDVLKIINQLSKKHTIIVISHDSDIVNTLSSSHTISLNENG